MSGQHGEAAAGRDSGGKALRARVLLALSGALVLAVMTWLWYQTSSLKPGAHARLESALCELRSLDRTVNQDVLRARYQLVSTYQPVLSSYRRMEELEAVVARPQAYLDASSRRSLSAAVIDYRAAVTSKQALIENFKYKSADLKDLLAYLPGAGTAIAKDAADGGDESLARDVNLVLRQTLLYSLTSDESYAPSIESELDGLSRDGETARTHEVRRRVRTFVLNVRTLLKIKPEVDRLLRRIVDAPVLRHEENVATIYYTGYTRAERVANYYRGALYALCITLLAVVAYGVRRLQRTASALAASNERLEGRVATRTRDLAMANEALAATSRSKSDFLANMSHEIRTPMSAVLGYADLLLDPGLDAAERLGHVQTIRRNGEHLLELINDILDLSKIEAGKASVEQVPCSPSQIVGEVASLMRARAAEKSLGLTITYLTPVPDTIASDPTRLRQILTNLVGNAVKFTERGGVRILMRCESGHTGRLRISFGVADTGIGLSKGQIAGLFQPFTQADTSTTRRFGGTGLGLTICQRFARMLGGEITVESAPSQGSTFTLTLDTEALPGVTMHRNLAEAGASMPEPAAAPAVERRLAGLRVLLAEDGRDNQRLISHHLVQAGAGVSIAENGQLCVTSALDALAAGQPFHVVLMDMQMPVLDGYDATASLRAHGYAGPIVALTAHAMTGDRDRCIAAGCDDYLTKPIKRAELVETVLRRVRTGEAPRDDGAAAQRGTTATT